MKKALITATPGGFLPQFELNNVKLLQEAGYEIHYGANLENHIYQWDQKALEDRQVVLHHVPFTNALMDIASHRRAYQQVADIIREEQIDLIHCHTPFAGVLTRLAAAHSKPRPYVIYTSHGFHFHKGASAKNWLFYPIEKHLSKKTDILITINKEDYQRAQAFHEGGELSGREPSSAKRKKHCQVKQIPGVGLHLDKFRHRPELYDWVREEYQIPKDGFHLVTIGELSEEKNVAVVIAAMRQLKHLPIYYSIFGKGPEMVHLSESIKAWNLEDRVKLRGYTTEPELVLQGADAFVFPSKREGLGMAALEAFACGVPVIAYDNRGTREYMKHGVNGLVCDSGEVNEYADAIFRAYTLRQEEKAGISDTYSKYKVACTKTAEKFRIENTEKIMRQIYQEVE